MTGPVETVECHTTLRGHRSGRDDLRRYSHLSPSPLPGVGTATGDSQTPGPDTVVGGWGWVYLALSAVLGPPS